MVFSNILVVQLVVRDARRHIHATQPTYIPLSLHVTAEYSLLGIGVPLPRAQHLLELSPWWSPASGWRQGTHFLEEAWGF